MISQSVIMDVVLFAPSKTQHKLNNSVFASMWTAHSANSLVCFSLRFYLAFAVPLFSLETEHLVHGCVLQDRCLMHLLAWMVSGSASCRCFFTSDRPSCSRAEIQESEYFRRAALNSPIPFL